MKMCLGLFLSAQLLIARVDGIIFSYNRPLQLYALLESIQQYVSGLHDLTVIYRVDSVDYEQGYANVKSDFPAVHYVLQGECPEQDFKPNVLQALTQGNSPYIFFAVDDMIVKGIIDLMQVAQEMEKHKAYGFYLRLGTHLTHDYAFNRMQPLPKFYKSDTIYLWQFKQSSGNWAYPHTVDMTVFRKKDIEDNLFDMYYSNPNTFEAIWSRLAYKVMHRTGICYEQSKVVNLPLNRVQETYGNRHMDFMSAQELLQIFMQGKKMNIKPLFCVRNRSAHMEYEPTFVNR